LGYVTVLGLVRDVDTSAARFPGITEGRALFLGVNGGLTLTPPTPPASTVFVGIAVRINTNDGIIWVDPKATDSLSELNDVYVPTRKVGDTLVYNGTIWVNQQPATGTNASTGTVTAGPSQVILANANTTDIVVILPDAATNANFNCYVKKVDTTGNYVYVRPTGTNTLDGDTQKFFNVPYTSMHVFGNGTNYFIL